MTDFGSVWDAADDVQADQSLRALTSARIQVAPTWSFLAVAKSPEEFGHRLALVEDRLHEAAADHGVTFEALAKSLVDDFRALASYYVESDGKEVGGPYDSKADAQDAIDGGDVSGDDLTVTQGGGDDDGDSDDSDGDDSDTDEDQDDAEGEPDDDDNPFAKKSALADLDALFPVVAAANVVHQPGETVFVDHFMGSHEHEGRKGVWATVVSGPGQHGHEDRAESHLLKPMAPGGSPFFHHFGSLSTTAGVQKTAYGDGPTRETYTYYHGNSGWKSGLGSYDYPDEDKTPGHSWKPHRVYDSISSAVNHLAGGAFNPHPERGDDLPGYGNLHHEQARDHASHLESYNHCNSCDHVYSTNHEEHQTSNGKDICPNCGDTDFHETVSDVLADSGHYDKPEHRTTYSDDHGPDYHGADGDNHGDPYGKHDRKIEASQKTALEDGVDPLQWILSVSPKGEGTAEVEAHHETTQRMATLIDLFRTATSE